VPFNFRLNLQDVFRRLGIQSGARLPLLEDDVRMTMQVTDLSRLIPAPIEPRGLCGATLIAMAGLHTVVQLQALAPGGLFVETVMFRGQGSLDSDAQVVNVSPADLGLPVSTFNINVGGTPIQSVFSTGWVFDGTGGITLPSPDGFVTWGIPLGIFVPNQSFLKIRPGFVNRTMNIAILYRELPAIEEVG